MLAKKLLGSPEFNADEAPELTQDMLENAEVFTGDTFVRRGRGRRPSVSPKEKINVRVDAPVLEKLRASGPGWQTSVNDGMAMWTGVDRRLWDWIEQMTLRHEEQLEVFRQTVELMESGKMGSSKNGVDNTAETLERDQRGIEQLYQVIVTMRTTQRVLQARYLGTDLDRLAVEA